MSLCVSTSYILNHDTCKHMWSQRMTMQQVAGKCGSRPSNQAITNIACHAALSGPTGSGPPDTPTWARQPLTIIIRHRLGVTYNLTGPVSAVKQVSGPTISFTAVCAVASVPARLIGGHLLQPMTWARSALSMQFRQSVAQQDTGTSPVVVDMEAQPKRVTYSESTPVLSLQVLFG